MSETEIDWTKYNERFIGMAKLVEEHEDINFLDKEGNTILMYASLFGYIDMVKLILEEDGVDVDLGNISPLGACTGRKILSYFYLNSLGEKWVLNSDESVYIAIIKILIENGADVNKQISGQHMLFWSVLSGNEAEVELLLKKTSNLDFKNDLWLNIFMASVVKGTSENPFNCFTGNGTKSMIELLMNNGANVNFQDKDGNTAYQFVKDTAKYDIIKLLIDHGADITLKPYATKDKTIEELKNIISEVKNKQAKMRDEKKYLLALDDVLETRNIEKLKLLASQNADFSKIDILKLIQNEYSTEFIEIVLKNNANINMQNSDGQTGLHLATIDKNLKLVELFLQCNADINIQDNNEWTNLMFATIQNDIELVELFLKNGAEINIEKKKGYSAFDMAIDSENLEIIKLYLSYLVKKNSPQKLSKLLKNFSSPKLKYTNHDWDDPTLTYEKFMRDVNDGWNEIKGDLKTLLSEKTYKNIEDFLFNDKLGELDSQGKIISWGDGITIGWSSKEIATTDNKPHLHKNFKEAMKHFKSLFVIKQDNKDLKLLKKFTKLRKENNYKFNLDLEQIKEADVENVFTDVHKLELALATILSEMNDRVDDGKGNVKVTLEQDEQKHTVILKIIHIGSTSKSDAAILEKAIEKDGGFKGIYKNLSSVCDWSIETICPDNKTYIQPISAI